MPSVAWILFHSDAKASGSGTRSLAAWPIAQSQFSLVRVVKVLPIFFIFFFFIPSIAGVLLHTTTQWLLVVVLFRWLVCGTNPFLSHIFLTNSFLSAAGHGNAEYPIASHQPLDPSTQPPNGSPPGGGGRLLAVWPIT